MTIIVIRMNTALIGYCTESRTNVTLCCTMLTGIGTILVLPILSGHFKVNDLSLAMVAVAFKVVQVSWASFSQDDWMVFFGLPMMILSSMFVPALKSVLSKIIADDEIGKIFGLSAFGETVSGLLGAVMFTAVYGASVHLWKGTAFILEAIVNIAVFGVLLWLSRNLANNYKTVLTEDIGAKKDPLSVQVESNTIADYQYKPAADLEEFEQNDEPGEVHLEISVNGQQPVDPLAISDLDGGTRSRPAPRARPPPPVRPTLGDTDDKPQMQASYGY